MDKRSKPCFSFQKGKCHYGDRCRYSHDLTASSAPSSRGPAKQNRIFGHEDAAIRGWLRSVSKVPSGSTRPLTVSELAEFCKTAFEIVSLDDATKTQQIITQLASDGGLARIQEVVKLCLDQLPDQERFSRFKSITLPLLRCITQDYVLASLVLEMAKGTIYNFLFGIGGRRAVKFLNVLADVVTSKTLSKFLADEFLALAISTILTVFLQIITCNQTAYLVEEFGGLAQRLAACLEDKDRLLHKTLDVQNSHNQLARIRDHLNLGSSVEIVTASVVPMTQGIPFFNLDIDWPGQRSPHGPRHDNDHEDIRNIDIMPTAGEIKSSRLEYLPTIDPSQSHVTGMKRLLDRQFRLLREDTVGQLRDCVRSVLEDLTTPNAKTAQSNRTQHGTRYLVYHEVALFNIAFERKKGLQVAAEFDQPHHVQSMRNEKERQRWWSETKQLQLDSLLCLADSNGTCVFFSVSQRHGLLSNEEEKDERIKTKLSETGISNLFNNQQRACITLRLIDMNENGIAEVLGRPYSDRGVRQVLVEFPGVLLPSFRPTLEALKEMDSRKQIPFSDLIAPAFTPEGYVGGYAEIDPPAYATQPGFRFDLGQITNGSSLSLKISEPFDVDALRRRSTLDEAQCKALVNALTRGLALIQGPPGTGKSYVAVQLVKVLLSCRKEARLGPIICVCYTNHALDQFLEHLLRDGTTQIVRLGGGSKSNVLEPLNLRNITAEMEDTKYSRTAAYNARESMRVTGEEIINLLQDLKSSSKSALVKDHLMVNYPHRFNELFKDTETDGFTKVRNSKRHPLDDWLHGKSYGAKSHNQPGSRGRPLLEMSLVGRRTLHARWVKEIRESLSRKLNAALKSYQESAEDLQQVRRDLDLLCLKESFLIGITTSGLAKNSELLRRLRPKVLICEEAGEILEAHTVTALLPSVEHAILIGDHEQLRPQIQNFDLSLENPRGRKFSLDVSLFERLISPQGPALRLPFDTLKVQRRMDPSISLFVRATLYPDLEDHEAVQGYPPVTGMRKRLFWLDHREPEARADPSQPMQTSHWNSWEADIIVALVTHIVRQGVYKEEQIAVLTPYVRQLQKLRLSLGNLFEIVLGDRDEEELEKEETNIGAAEQQGIDPAKLLSPRLPAVQKSKLSERVRIATVDNFQGEEADVVIVSMVRSNQEKRCGFLKTSNRINVLLSRARHGMYIVGNSETYNEIPMWNRVIALLHGEDNIGSKFPLCCPRHPDTAIEVANADDFSRFSPEGGCALPCHLRLDCGHACTFKCHSKPRHDTTRCQEPCPRRKDSCEHKCPRKCGEPCEVLCSANVNNVHLPCGHIRSQAKCFQAQDLSLINCTRLVEKDVPGCLHTIQIQCCKSNLNSSFRCPAKCGTTRSCGHNCERKCKDCRVTEEDGSVIINHGDCSSRCGRPYNSCNHSCSANCHGEKPCPLCSSQCQVACVHSTCSKMCGEPCAPCAEICGAGCPHKGTCDLPCAVPCTTLPCSRRCERKLPCGHQCPSICGESCPSPKYCQVCAPPDLQNSMVDYIECSTYKEIDLDNDPIVVPRCGHLLTRTSMDGHMDISKHYEMSEKGHIEAVRSSAAPLSSEDLKACPLCRSPLRNLHRYNRIVKRGLIDEATKRFIVWANSTFIPLEEKLQNQQIVLQDTEFILFRQLKEADAPTPKMFDPTVIEFKESRDAQICQIRQLVGLQSRYQSILNLRTGIRKFLQGVSTAEQPFSKVYRMVRDAQRSTGKELQFPANDNILRVRESLLATSLLLRCDLIILSDFLKIFREQSKSRVSPYKWPKAKLTMNLAKARAECKELANNAITQEQPMQEIEARIYFARFVALERASPAEANPEKTQLLFDEATKHLDSARKTCSRSLNTKTMLGEVEEIDRLLKQSDFYTTFTNDEKRAVYAAMATEFRGTGHWYYCENGHLFTVGECGMPMQTSRCPQCGASVGGQSHQSVAGVTNARDMDDQFGRMNL